MWHATQLSLSGNHFSANSWGTGGDLGPELRALLGNRALDSRTLHLALIVDDNTGIVLKVDEHALAAPPGLLLADDDTLQHLFAQLWLSFLDSAQNHVARAALGHHVKA